MCVCLNIHASKNVSQRIYKKLITLVWLPVGKRREEGSLGVKGGKEISHCRYLYLSNFIIHIQQTNIK